MVRDPPLATDPPFAARALNVDRNSYLLSSFADDMRPQQSAYGIILVYTEILIRVLLIGFSLMILRQFPQTRMPDCRVVLPTDASYL